MESSNPEILVILETRIDPLKIKRTFALLGFEGFISSEVRGFARGIVVVWKENYANISLISKGFQHIHLKVDSQIDGEWFFTLIYASPNDDTRSELWDELFLIASSCNGKWLVAGDFNDIASQDEKKGGAPINQRKCNIFMERIDRCNLMDMGAIGSKFTWRGPLYHGYSSIFEKLDRALCNVDWRLGFPEAFVKVLPCIDFSDHHPILISLHNLHNVRQPRPFRFETDWQTHSLFPDVVKNCWIRDLDMPQKLKSLEEDLIDWNINIFGNTKKKKQIILARLVGIQKKKL